MVREGAYRASKYAAKLRDGKIHEERVKNYGKIQKKKFKSSVQKQVQIEQETKKLVGSGDILLNLPYYIIFAKEVNMVAKTHSGNTAYAELQILDNKWASRGLKVNILNSIKSYYVPGYPVAPPPVYFRLDVSLLDGPDVLE